MQNRTLPLARIILLLAVSALLGYLYLFDIQRVSAYTALTLEKTASTNPAQYDHVDQVIEYSYTLTNTGTDTLSAPFTVSDNKTTVTCLPTPTSLAQNESLTCNATYPVTQDDLDNGSVTNTATGHAFFVTTPVDSIQTTATVNAKQTKRLSLTKTAIETGFDAPGVTLHYTLVATNDGNVTLTDVNITDAKLGTLTCTQPVTLAPLATLSCTGTHITTQADVNAGKYDNTANASGTFNAAPVNAAPASKSVPATQNPHLSLTKTATETSFNAPGVTLHYTLVATNDGNVTLTDVNITDAKLGTLTCTQPVTLAPLATLSCTGTHITTQADVNAGKYDNTANASGKFNAALVNAAPASKSVPAIQNPALTIVKTASPKTYNAVGNVIVYSYLVTNSGNASLADPVTVTDNKATNVTCPNVNTVGNHNGYLDPVESITCLATYTIIQTDLNAGFVTNIASASAGGTTSPTDTETVNAILSPALTIVKNANPTTYNAVGIVIGYSFLVTNTGNTSLVGPVTVADNKTNNEICPNVNTVGNLDGYLDVGESITCTASYTITQADLNAGSVTNIASASAGGITSPTDTETVNAILGPALTIVKNANPTTYTAVGNVIGYSFLVTNTGNVRLTGPVPVVVVDDKATNEICPDVTTVGNLDGYLDPGESITCTASYTILRSDMASGSVTNAAYATGKFGEVTMISNIDHVTITATHTFRYAYLPLSIVSRPGVQILPKSSSYESHGTLYIVGEVLNNTSNTLGSVKIIVNLYDAAGQPVDMSSYTYYPYLWPNDLPAWSQGCFKLRMVIPPSGYSFQFKAPEYVIGDTSPGLTILGDSRSYNGDNYVINSKIRNNGNLISKNVIVSATLYNDTGMPVDCERSVTSDIIPGAISDFNITFLGYYRNYSDVTQYRLRVAGELP